MSGKKANNSPGLCPIKGQKSGLSARTGPEINSLSIPKTSPPCQMLVIHPPFYLSSYILPRHPEGRLRSYKLVKRTVSCELVGNFFSLYPSMSWDPIQCAG
jgi:hypothetical protein